MIKKRIKILISLILIVSILLPFDINVKFTTVTYENHTADSIKIMASSLLGTHEYKNVKYTTVDKPLSTTVSAKFLTLSSTTKQDKIPVKEVNAEYIGDKHIGASYSKDDIETTLVYEDGYTEKTDDYTIISNVISNKNTKISVTSDYGITTAEVDAIEPDKIITDAKLSKYEGDSSEDNYTITLQYEDGITKEVENVTTDDEFISDNISTQFGEVEVSNLIKIKRIYIDIDNELYEDDDIKDVPVTVEYEDGTKKVLDQSTYSWISDTKLSAGHNLLRLEYNSILIDIDVYAVENTLAHQAYIKNYDEYTSATEKYYSKNIFVAVTDHVNDEYAYKLAHIVTNSGAQLKDAISNDEYGGSRELPVDAANRLNWVIGTNASMFNYDDGKPMDIGVKIKNYEVMEDSAKVTSGLEICLTEDGNLYQPESGITVEELLDNGVKSTFLYGDPAIIKDGEKNEEFNFNNYNYPRTVIGMVKPGEYYVLVSNNQGYDGPTYKELQDIFIDLGCEFAACLDGGGSSQLIFNNELINKTAQNKERAVVDFIYFTDEIMENSNNEEII